jgi:DNA repair protein RadC
MTNAQKARRLLASRPDLVDRVLFLAAEPGAVVTTPGDVLPTIRRHLDGRDHEALVCIGLTRRHHIVGSAVLTTGSDALTVVDPRQVYRWALTRPRPVAAIILAHNHPSGDPTPSEQDYDVTERVARAGRVLGIGLLDHIVLGEAGRFVSINSVRPFAGYASPVASWTGA